jgi:hypothetical protein
VFSVVTPASDITLATIQQLRVAAGLAPNDGSNDEALTELGKRLAADVSTACCIASDGVNPPTLRSETVADTYRLKSHHKLLILSRRFVSSLTTVVENDAALTSDQYELDAEAGLLRRLSGDTEICWPCGKVVVTYVAGFATVPADLSGVVADEARLRLSESSNDPLAKSIRISIPEIEDREVQRWVGDMPNRTGGPLSESNMRRLTRYINPVVG